MNTFLEYHKQLKQLTEQAQAKKGDWKGGIEFIRNFSSFTIYSDYKFEHDIKIKDLGTLKLYKHKTNNAYVAGIFIETTDLTKEGKKTETTFKGVFSISFEEIKLKDFSNCVVVKGVSVTDDETYQKSGISTTMYKFFVKNKKLTIVGDGEQYFGARKLWSKLSNSIDVKVDIYDIQKQELIFSDVILHHGHYNSDFDERLWSYSKSKLNLRSILTDIGD
jgi:hypothetical protein